MSNVLKNLSEAAKLVSSSTKPMRESVYGAYREHLSNIDTNDLPENIQIIHESVIDRLTSVEPIGDIGEDEAANLATDILHMADVIRVKE